MSFLAESGLIEVRDDADNLRLSTDVDMLHIVNIIPADSIAFGNVVASSSTSRNETDDFVIGSCHPACNVVIGAITISASEQDGHGIRLNTYTSYMGGDLVWLMTSPGLTAGTAGARLETPHSAITYRFFCSGGDVILRRRLIQPEVSSDITYVFLAHTLLYRLRTGRFS
jgi:hypothetical protein